MKNKVAKKIRKLARAQNLQYRPAKKQYQKLDHKNKRVFNEKLDELIKK